MTLDLVHLRRLADAAHKDSPFREDSRQTSEAYDAWFDAWRAFRGATTPTVILELLDRLQQAEDTLANARAHWRITAGDSYAMSGMGRILGEPEEGPAVFRTLMTQVGKEKP